MSAAALLKDRSLPGPVWIGLDEQTKMLTPSDQIQLNNVTEAFRSVQNINTLGDAQLWKLIGNLPAKLYPFISQATTAWLALRRTHAVTASVAFDILLCGTGPARERYGHEDKTLKISGYRKCARLPVNTVASGDQGHRSR